MPDLAKGVSKTIAYKPYFFSQRTVFFSHNKSINSTFSHVLSTKRTDHSLVDISPQQSHALGTINIRTIAKKHQTSLPQCYSRSHIVMKNTARQTSTYVLRSADECPLDDRRSSFARSACPPVFKTNMSPNIYIYFLRITKYNVDIRNTHAHSPPIDTRTQTISLRAPPKGRLVVNGDVAYH